MHLARSSSTDKCFFYAWLVKVIEARENRPGASDRTVLTRVPGPRNKDVVFVCGNYSGTAKQQH